MLTGLVFIFTSKRFRNVSEVFPGRQAGENRSQFRNVDSRTFQIFFSILERRCWQLFKDGFGVGLLHELDVGVWNFGIFCGRQPFFDQRNLTKKNNVIKQRWNSRGKCYTHSLDRYLMAKNWFWGQKCLNSQTKTVRQAKILWNDISCGLKKNEVITMTNIYFGLSPRRGLFRYPKKMTESDL